jgi:hypothetical protein
MADLREYTRESLLILWRTYCEAGLAADTDELRAFVVDGLADVEAKLQLIDGIEVETPVILAGQEPKNVRVVEARVVRHNDGTLHPAACGPRCRSQHTDDHSGCEHIDGLDAGTLEP